MGSIKNEGSRYAINGVKITIPPFAQSTDINSTQYLSATVNGQDTEADI